MKTRNLFAAFVFALIGTATLRANERTFQTFTLPGGKMEIKMPGTPVEQKQTQKTLLGNMEIRTNIAMDPNKGIGYVAATFDFPLAVRNQVGDGSAHLDGLVTGFVSGANGKLVSKKMIRVAGSPGLEVKATLFDGNGELHGQFCVIDGTVYVIAIMAPKDGMNVLDSALFFNSFQKASGLR